MAEANQFTPIYSRLRALLGNTLPVTNFEAARQLLEVGGNSQERIIELYAKSIGAVATKVSGQVFSTKGFSLLKQLEGLRTRAYLDGAGVPTIGYGNTYHPNGTKVKLGDVITQDQADSYLRAIVGNYENTVRKVIAVPLTQNQYDALVCFVYNIGSTAFINSSVDDKINAGDLDAAMIAWAAHNKVRNPKTGKLEVSNGLNNRRAAELKLFKLQ